MSHGRYPSQHGHFPATYQPDASNGTFATPNPSYPVAQASRHHMPYGQVPAGHPSAQYDPSYPRPRTSSNALLASPLAGRSSQQPSARARSSSISVPVPHPSTSRHYPTPTPTPSTTQIYGHARSHSQAHAPSYPSAASGYPQSPPSSYPSSPPGAMYAHQSGDSGQYPASPQRAFPCDLCALSFSRLHDLKRHKETHTGDKPFECNGGCRKTFTRKDALKRHQVRGIPCPCMFWG